MPDISDKEFQELWNSFKDITQTGNMDEVVKNIVLTLDQESRESLSVDAIRETVINTLNGPDFFEDSNEYYDENIVAEDEDSNHISFNTSTSNEIVAAENLVQLVPQQILDQNNNKKSKTRPNHDIVEKIRAYLATEIRVENIKKTLDLLQKAMNTTQSEAGKVEPSLYYILKKYLESDIEAFQGCIKLILSYKYTQAIKKLTTWKINENRPCFLLEYIQQAMKNTQGNDNAFQEVIHTILISQCVDAIRLLLPKYLEDFLQCAQRDAEESGDSAVLDKAIRSILSSACGEAIRLLLLANYLEDFLERAQRVAEASGNSAMLDKAIRAILTSHCGEAIRLLLPQYLGDFLQRVRHAAEASGNSAIEDEVIRLILSSQNSKVIRLLLPQYLGDFLQRARHAAEESGSSVIEDEAIRSILSSRYTKATEILLLQPTKELCYLVGYLKCPEEQEQNSGKIFREKIINIFKSRSFKIIDFLILQPSKESSYLIKYFETIDSLIEDPKKRDEALTNAISSIFSSVSPSAIKWLYEYKREEVENFCNSGKKLNKCAKKIVDYQCYLLRNFELLVQAKEKLLEDCLNTNTSRNIRDSRNNISIQAQEEMEEIPNFETNVAIEKSSSSKNKNKKKDDNSFHGSDLLDNEISDTERVSSETSDSEISEEERYQSNVKQKKVSGSSYAAVSLSLTKNNNKKLSGQSGQKRSRIETDVNLNFRANKKNGTSFGSGTMFPATGKRATNINVAAIPAAKGRNRK